MRYVVLGTSELAVSLARAIMDSGEELVLMVSMPPDLLPDNSIDVKGFCCDSGVTYAEVADLNSAKSIEMLRNAEPDYIVSGWPKIISQEVLVIPKYIVIGSHPTPLPMCRGRHPIHWLIVLGAQYTSLNFFVMDQGVDTGRVLLSVPFPVGNRAIAEINHDMNLYGYDGMISLIDVLRANNSFSGYKQHGGVGNYLRKRNKHDVALDPRMNYEMISRIVNSYASPYPGARLWVGYNQYLTVAGVERCPVDVLPSDWRDYEHGHIFSDIGGVVMRVMDEAVRLDLEDDNIEALKLSGKRIFPPSYYFDLS